MWKLARTSTEKICLAARPQACQSCGKKSYRVENIRTGLLLPSRNVTSSTHQSTDKTSISNTRTFKSSSSSEDDDGIPAGGWFLLIIPVSTLCLGIWQVARWRWKLGLIDEMRNKSIADPVALPENEEDLLALEYQKVKVRGQFDYSKEVLMGPRSLVIPEDRTSERGRGVFSSGATNNGYLVITPFQLEGTNERILVNRGWINARSADKFKHVSGTVDIVGIVRKTENRAPFMNKNKPGQNLLHYRDVPAMSELLNTKHIFLDLYSIDGVDFSNARKDSIPVPRQTRVTLRNEHVSYFVTWFSLSAITSFMWHRRFIRRLNLL